MDSNLLQPLAVGLNEAAAMIGIAPRTLRKWAVDGRVVSIKAGSRLLFRIAALEDFLRQNERPAVNGPRKESDYASQP